MRTDDDNNALNHAHSADSFVLKCTAEMFHFPFQMSANFDLQSIKTQCRLNQLHVLSDDDDD